MAGTEIRLDLPRVQEVLAALRLVEKDLEPAVSPPPDVSIAVMGHQIAASASEEFLARWSEGRTRISDTVALVRNQGTRAIENLQQADLSIQAATY